MERKIINTEKAPGAIGPYVQGTKLGNMIFTSGQIPVVASTGEVPTDVQEQTKIALQNLKYVLEEGGSSLDNVVKTTVFIKDMNEFNLINEVYAQFFPNSKPSRSCVEVARLPKDVKVEIEAIAYIK